MPQTNKRLLYQVSGQLPRGFQGHISCTTLLPEELRALRTVFPFDKREPQQKPYDGACEPAHLLAVGAPLYFDKEGNG